MADRPPAEPEAQTASYSPPPHHRPDWIGPSGVRSTAGDAQQPVPGWAGTQTRRHAGTTPRDEAHAAGSPSEAASSSPSRQR